jgi:hypothetical protein
MNKRYLVHLGVLGFYTGLSLLLTWPLVAHLASHVPGEATWAFDESTFLWNIWWFKFSLLQLRQSPLVSSYIFFPLGIHLTTYTFNLFNAAFALPLQLTLNLPLASNLTMIFSLISSAYGAFLLVLYLLAPVPISWPARYLAATLAGAVFAFSASRMMYLALGHYNFATIQWFPFYVLFLLKMLRQGTLRIIILAGLFAAFCLYAELTYSVFLLFITLLILGGEWLNRRLPIGDETLHPSIRLTSTLRQAQDVAQDARFHSQYKADIPSFSFTASLIRLSLLALITFGLTSPFILAVLPDFLDPAYAEPGWGEGLKLSADLVGLVTLTPLHPLSGLDWQMELRAVTEGTSRFSDANTLFLGYGILALALLSVLVYRRRVRVWLWGALLFTLLSLGPLLALNGRNRFNLDGLEVTFPLPFILLHYLPVLNANRVPNRFGIPLTLALAVLVGYVVAWLNSRVSWWGGRRTSLSLSYRSRIALLIFNLLLLFLLLFDQYSVPLPLTDARTPEVYTQIGAEPEQFTLLQLPLGWRNSYGMLGAEQTQLQYYQSIHQRPILGGNTSRNPEFKFSYYSNIPLFTALIGAETYQPVDEVTLSRARQQAAQLMALYNIKYLVIHEPVPFRRPYEDTFEATRSLALELIPHQPEPVYHSPGVQAFAVQQADLPDSLRIDFGDWTAFPYRGEDWAGDEEIFSATANWAVAEEAEIFFPIRGLSERQLVLQIAPFSYLGLPEQQVHFSLNGQRLDRIFSLREGWQVIELALPEIALKQGLNRLTLHFGRLTEPRQVLPAEVMIGETGVAMPLDLEVNSGSDFAFITVGFGEEAVDASAHRRGINLAVIDPVSGALLSAKGFDTAANEFEAAALRQFIAAIPAGQIVIVASQGPEATTFLGAETLAALQSLGLAPEALLPPFSAIGVKGAPAGTTLQASGEGTAYLRLGRSPDTRPLAAAVDWVSISSP